MSGMPILYWVVGSTALWLATVGLTAALPVPGVIDAAAKYSIIFWYVAWAYSPLRQGPPASRESPYKRRQKTWGFTVKYDDGCDDSPD